MWLLGLAMPRKYVAGLIEGWSRMSDRGLEIGMTVHFARLAFGSGTDAHEFRVMQLLHLDGGAMLYRIKCESEPFDRVVAEADLANVA